jgi:hypothetical protein
MGEKAERRRNEGGTNWAARQESVRSLSDKKAAPYPHLKEGVCGAAFSIKRLQDRQIMTVGGGARERVGRARRSDPDPGQQHAPTHAAPTASREQVKHLPSAGSLTRPRPRPSVYSISAGTIPD